MSKIRILLLMMLTTFAWSAIMADDFNPQNPPEPDDIYVYKHNIKVTATPAGKGYTSGTGRYAEGKSVTISTSSAVANWVFKRWLKNGELDTEHTSASFRFVLGTQDVEFTAEYEYVEPQEPDDPEPPVLPPFEPDDPAEPQTPVFPDEPDDPQPPVVTPKYTLDLVSSPFEACSFNRNSGLSYTAGTNINIIATGNQGFVFLGWYDQDDNLLAETTALGYTIPEANTTLTAKWVFNPSTDPSEPESTQDNVFNPLFGDVNADGRFNVIDVMLAVEFTKGKEPADGIKSAADVDKDGKNTVLDIMKIVERIKLPTE